MSFNKLLNNIRLFLSPFVISVVMTLVAISISIYCLSSGWVIIFQNLFYFPIIITCIFYAKKGFVFSVILSFIYLFLIIAFTGEPVVVIQALIRISIFIGVAGVITFLSIKRNQAEEALRKSEECYHTVADFTYDWKYWLTTDGKLFHMSPSCEVITGYGADEFQQNPGLLSLIIHPDDVEKFEKHVRTENVMGGNDYSEHEFRIFTRNGKERWISHACQPIYDRHGQYMGRRVRNRDITEHKHTEEVLTFLAQCGGINLDDGFFEALAMYLANSMKMDFVRIERLEDDNLTSNTVALWCDGRFEDNVSYNLKDTPGEDVVGKTVCCFPAGVCQLFPHDPVLKDLRAESYTGVTLWSHSGHPIGLIAVIGRSPLTNRPLVESIMKIVAVRAGAELERLEAEKEKKKIQEQLLHAHKMEAVGKLAGGIAHDFNNILGLIMGFAEISFDYMDNKDILQQNLNQIIKAGNRARNLVSQILSFSRKRESEKKPTKISLIIKEVVNLMRSSLPSTIEIIQNIEAEDSLICADSTQIYQILVNLCTNSYHAIKNTKGVLEISLVTADMSDTAICTEIKPDDYVKITVKDNGCGMEKNIMDRIFEPYFTTKVIGEGTGLGLSVVHGIVERHNGYIKVHSEPGKGTVFYIFLPKIKTDFSEQKEISKELPGGNEHIFIIDDEEHLIKVMKMFLNKLGYKATSAKNSREALEIFRKEPELFDLIITDKTMPFITGIELSKEIINIRPDIPIILCTGFEDISDNEFLKSSVIKKILIKPVVLSVLAEAIREVLG